MKKLAIILVIVSFCGCGVFKTKLEDFEKLDSENVKLLNGSYSVFAQNCDPNFPYLNNANEMFYRKYGRGRRDTIHFDSISNGKMKISIINENKIGFEFSDKNKIVRNQIFTYKLKDDGFVYIKNRNTLIGGLPYIFGGIDVRKIRIGLGSKKELIINDVFDSSGAFLLIFGDAKVWENSNRYDRIE